MNEKLNTAKSLYQQGKNQEAALILKEILQQDPTNTAAWYGLFLCSTTQKNKNFCLRKILQINPQHPQALAAWKKINASNGEVETNSDLRSSNYQPPAPASSAKVFQQQNQLEINSPGASKKQNFSRFSLPFSFQSHKKTKLILLGVGSLVGACCLCGMINSLFSSPKNSDFVLTQSIHEKSVVSSTLTAQAEYFHETQLFVAMVQTQNAPTATAIPTWTPEPTATQIPPTDLPQPQPAVVLPPSGLPPQPENLIPPPDPLFLAVPGIPPVAAGSIATVRLQTVPGATCSITVYYKEGVSTAAGLGSQLADGNGNASWSWKVGNNTTPGDYNIFVSVSLNGQGSSVTIPFTVQ